MGSRDLASLLVQTSAERAATKRSRRVVTDAKVDAARVRRPLRRQFEEAPATVVRREPHLDRDPSREHRRAERPVHLEQALVAVEPIEPKVAVVVARAGPPGFEDCLQAGAGHVDETPERGAVDERGDGDVGRG